MDATQDREAQALQAAMPRTAVEMLDVQRRKLIEEGARPLGLDKPWTREGVYRAALAAGDVGLAAAMVALSSDPRSKSPDVDPQYVEWPGGPPQPDGMAKAAEGERRLDEFCAEAGSWNPIPPTPDLARCGRVIRSVTGDDPTLKALSGLMTRARQVLKMRGYLRDRIMAKMGDGADLQAGLALATAAGVAPAQGCPSAGGRRRRPVRER